MKSLRFDLCVSIFIAVAGLTKLASGGVYQKLLLRKLFENYNPFERPAEFENQTLDVKLGMALQQIVDVDEKKQTIVWSGWLDMSWNDYNLKWDPAEFGNITSIRVMSSHIWIPDLILYNSADDAFDTTAKVNAVLYADGTVSYLPPGIFKSTCQIKIQDFPFDEQSCDVKFGSWTYDDESVNLSNKSDSAQLDSYILNGEWHLINVTSYSESKKYECCTEKYSFVMFVINIRRRTLYFLFNLIFPCVLISFMCVLGFTLPPDSGEKIALEITTLLSIIMFLQLITGIIPESSLSVPKISVYFGSVMVICSMSIIANVVVLIFHHRNVKIQHPMAKWIDVWICGYMARFLNMEIPNKKFTRKERQKKEELYRNSSLNELSELSSKSLLANVLDINDDFGVINVNKLNHQKSAAESASYRQVNSHNMNYQASLPHSRSHSPHQHQHTPTRFGGGGGGGGGGVYRRTPGGGHSVDEAASASASYSNDYALSPAATAASIHRANEMYSLRKNLNHILRELKVITAKIKEEEEHERNSLNWKFAAMVIDRLCMVFFAIATFFSFMIILLTSKNFFMLS